MSRGVVIGVVIVVIAAAAGFLAQRTLTQGSSLTPVEVSQTSPAAASSAEPASGEAEDGPPARRPIPETLPDISLPDMGGTPRSLSDWKGRPLIVNFWATWCGPCREEIPLLKTLRKERSGEELEIIGIAIDEPGAVTRYARDMGIDYPILIGEQEGYEAAEAFGVALVLPFSVFADRQGRIVTLKVGELHAEEASFILDRVRDVDTDRLELAAARQQIADKMRDLAIERGKQHAGEHG